MDRRRVAGAAAGIVALVLLLVLASSSGPVRVWVANPAKVDTSPNPEIGTIDTVVQQAPVVPEHDDGQPWGGFFAQVLGVSMIILVAAAAAWARKAGLWPRLERYWAYQKRDRSIEALPEVRERDISVDVDAARIALSEGSARNAIVACWMQLERDAAAAGLPRDQSETSAEYVERVVAESSVDPAPIRELAALFREARFSRHELDEERRGRAVTALDRVEGALRHTVGALA